MKKGNAMKAMILAAGLGTRLKPLTEHCPKALMPVANRPLLDRNIEYLKSSGVEEIVVNTHHLPEQILHHIGDGSAFGIPIQVRVEPEILGTGGGIQNVSDFWDEEPFIVLNGDILTDIDLDAAYKAHVESGALATLVLHSREPFNQLLVDPEGNIQDIAEKNLPGRLAFTGIHIIDPALLTYIPVGCYSNIVEVYRHLITSRQIILGYLSEGHRWHDIGTVPSYLAANRDSLKGTPFLLGSKCKVHDDARLSDWAVIGESCRVHDAAHVERSVLWDHVTVHRGVNVIDSVVTSFQEVREDIIGRVF
ncbi:MAG: NDP-sugar synthase [Deltaproteobacteria bacterium]|nr:NDP-sugar synthase [Deltaproteobacteria bacterium]